MHQHFHWKESYYPFLMSSAIQDLRWHELKGVGNWTVNWVGGFIQLVIRCWQLEDHPSLTFTKNTFLSPDVNCMSIEANVPTQQHRGEKGAFKHWEKSLKATATALFLQHRTTAPNPLRAAFTRDFSSFPREPPVFQGCSFTDTKKLQWAPHSSFSWSG